MKSKSNGCLFSSWIMKIANNDDLHNLHNDLHNLSRMMFRCPYLKGTVRLARHVVIYSAHECNHCCDYMDVQSCVVLITLSVILPSICLPKHLYPWIFVTHNILYVLLLLLQTRCGYLLMNQTANWMLQLPGTDLKGEGLAAPPFYLVFY